MSDYQPLDLTDYYNATQRIWPVTRSPAIGDQMFHGLPFRIGTGKGKCFIAFGPRRRRRPLTLDIGRRAHWLIIAHQLLESRLPQGEPAGGLVATYRVRYRNGDEVAIPVRERFEIAMAPSGFGMSTFAAVPDHPESLLPRYQGSWSAAGRRLTEANGAAARDYYLMPWQNPHPRAVIESLTIEPAERQFLIAAITLGLTAESPFPRVAKREVKLSIRDETIARRPFDLQVEVDRGVTTYAHPLPVADPDAFLGDVFKGWGERQNSANSPAYVEIAATPSATVTVKSGDEVVGAVKWGDVERKGRVSAPKVRVELADRGRNWVHTTVLDADTGEPVPCRIHFRSPDGIPYQPHGHHNHVCSNLGSWHYDVGGDLRLGQITYAYIDGTCQGWLPRGDVLVDVARGYEYEPLRKRVRVRPGQRELTLRLKRRCHMNREGWYSGDTHVHFLSTQGGHFEAAGEGINVVNLLQSQWGHLFTNTEEFTGRPSVSPNGETIVYAAQENRQHILGHLTLLGLKTPVMPWCSDGPGEAELGGSMETTLAHWADACHAQGGTVVIPHMPNPNCEPAVLVATGRADAVEHCRLDLYGQSHYYRFLNCGYRLPLVGGTDKMSSDVPVGLYRTYARIPTNRRFTYENWLRAVREGRTFVSGGPLIRLTVEGGQIGDTVRLPGNGGQVEVEAAVDSIFPVHCLQIVHNGEPVLSTERKRGARKLALRGKVRVEGHSWLAARCGGPGYWEGRPHFDAWQRRMFAHTSPVYIAVGGPWEMFDVESAQYMLTLVEGGLTYIRHTARHYPDDEVTHHHGQNDHQRFLEEPFHEAAAALHRRLHAAGVAH